MSNDPSETVVDWSKITPSSTTNTSDQSLMTMCTEGANLMGVETAESNPLKSYETFSKNDESK